MPEPAMRVRDLSYAYGGRWALRDVSMTVPRGGVTALIGPNGAGKSTLLTLACGLLPPPPGTIEILGHDMAVSPRKALAGMGLVFQQSTLDLDLSVAQNLRGFASLHGLPRRRSEARMEAELARFGLSARAGDKVRALNGGHRRRVEIAAEDRVVVLDRARVRAEGDVADVLAAADASDLPQAFDRLTAAAPA